MKKSHWLSDEPTPDVPSASDAELLDIWRTNRNSLLSTVAASEMMKRLDQRQQKENDNG